MKPTFRAAGRWRLFFRTADAAGTAALAVVWPIPLC